MISMSYCPECKKWVPSKYLEAEWDPYEQKVVAMCAHCIAEFAGDNSEDLFDWDKCVYDPHFGEIRCPLCGSKGQPGETMHELDPKSTKEHWWHCDHCNKNFRRYA